MNVEMSGMFLENLFLLFVRTVSLFSSAPIFGQRNIPAQVRIGLAGLMSYVLLQASPNSIASMPDSIGYYALLVSNEVIFGLLLGFIATLAVTGLTMAGTSERTVSNTSTCKVPIAPSGVPPSICSVSAGPAELAGSRLAEHADVMITMTNSGNAVTRRIN